MSGENQKKGKILASKFVNWYYSDKMDTIIAGKDVIVSIKTFGHYNVTVKEVYDSCGPAIPGCICHDLINPEDENEDSLTPEELDLVDDITKSPVVKDNDFHTKIAEYIINEGNSPIDEIEFLIQNLPSHLLEELEESYRTVIP